MARILVTGGGTGGHLFPAVAVGEILAARGHQVVYVGSAHGLEARQPWTSRLPRELIPVRGVARGSVASALRSALLAPRWIVSALELLRRVRPALVAGFGGYASAPMVLASLLSRTPYVLHESNATPGAVNRWLSRGAVRFLVAVPGGTGAGSGGSARGIVPTGTPVRPGIAKLFRGKRRKSVALQHFGLPGKSKCLLIMPGSQGSRKLNELVLLALGSLSSVPKLSLVWTTGERDYASVRLAARRSRLPCAVFPFLARVERAYAAADLFVGRAGSSTLAELACARLPAILVPYAHAAEGHQRANAGAFEQAGAAVVREEASLTGEGLAATVRELLASRRLPRMAAAAGGLARPDAGERIATEIERVIGRV